jgi:hypothetical protein
MPTVSVAVVGTAAGAAAEAAAEPEERITLRVFTAMAVND